MAAQFDEKPRGSEMAPERRHRRRATGEQLRQQGDHRHQAGNDQVAPALEPA